MSGLSVNRPAIHGLASEIAVPMSNSKRIRNRVQALGLTSFSRAEYFIGVWLFLESPSYLEDVFYRYLW